MSERLRPALAWSRTRRESTLASPARAEAAEVRARAQSVLTEVRGRSATAPARLYDQSKSYRAGDLVAHPAFGVGRVSVVRGDKIEVCFGRTKKVLVHARRGR